MIDGLKIDLDVEDATPGQRKLYKALAEFEHYIDANTLWMPNYGEHYRCGDLQRVRRIAVNQVISKRMVKKQQMHWTPRGAHLPQWARRTLASSPRNQKRDSTLVHLSRPRRAVTAAVTVTAACVYVRYCPNERSGPWSLGKFWLLRTWMPALCSPLNGVTVAGQPALAASFGELNHRPRW